MHEEEEDLAPARNGSPLASAVVGELTAAPTSSFIRPFLLTRIEAFLNAILEPAPSDGENTGLNRRNSTGSTSNANNASGKTGSPAKERASAKPPMNMMTPPNKRFLILSSERGTGKTPSIEEALRVAKTTIPGMTLASFAFRSRLERPPFTVRDCLLSLLSQLPPPAPDDPLLVAYEALKQQNTSTGGQTAGGATDSGKAGTKKQDPRLMDSSEICLKHLVPALCRAQGKALLVIDAPERCDRAELSRLWHMLFELLPKVLNDQDQQARHVGILVATNLDVRTYVPVCQMLDPSDADICRRVSTAISPDRDSSMRDFVTGMSGSLTVQAMEEIARKSSYSTLFALVLHRVHLRTPGSLPDDFLTMMNLLYEPWWAPHLVSRGAKIPTILTRMLELTAHRLDDAKRFFFYNTLLPCEAVTDWFHDDVVCPHNQARRASGHLSLTRAMDTLSHVPEGEGVDEEENEAGLMYRARHGAHHAIECGDLDTARSYLVDITRNLAMALRGQRDLLATKPAAADPSYLSDFDDPLLGPLNDYLRDAERYQRLRPQDVSVRLLYGTIQQSRFALAGALKSPRRPALLDVLLFQLQGRAPHPVRDDEAKERISQISTTVTRRLTQRGSWRVCAPTMTRWPECMLRTFRGHSDSILSVTPVRFLKEQDDLADIQRHTYFCSGSMDGTVRLTNVYTGECIATLRDKKAHYSGFVASCSASLWLERKTDPLQQHDEDPYDAYISVLVGTQDGVARLYRVNPTIGSRYVDPDPVCLVGHIGVVMGVHLSRDAENAFTCSADGTLRKWSLPPTPHTLRHRKGPVNPQDNDKKATPEFPDPVCLLVMGSADMGPCFCLHVAYSAVRNRKSSALGTQPVNLNKKRYIVVTGYKNGTLRTWDFETGAETSKYVFEHAPTFTSVTTSTSRGLLATSSWDCTVSIFDISANDTIDQGPIYSLMHRDWIWGVAFAGPDDCLLASALENGTLHVWSVEKRKKLSVVDPHQGFGIYAVSSISGLVLSGSLDGTVKSHDFRGKIVSMAQKQREQDPAAEGEEEEAYESETEDMILTEELEEESRKRGKVCAVAFGTGPSRYFCFTAEVGDIGCRAWDVYTGQCTWSVKAYKTGTPTVQVYVSRDGTRVRTVDRSGAVLLLDALTGAKDVGSVSNAFMESMCCCFDSESFESERRMNPSASWRINARRIASTFVPRGGDRSTLTNVILLPTTPRRPKGEDKSAPPPPQTLGEYTFDTPVDAWISLASDSDVHVALVAESSGGKIHLLNLTRTSTEKMSEAGAFER